MSYQTITLYTTSWGGYWDTYGQQWASLVNNFNTTPDEILILSDEPLDTSLLVHNNIKNIVAVPPKNARKASYYKNLAVEKASSDWVVQLDLDDRAFPNYLDDLDPESDIHAFSFSQGDNEYYPDKDSLYNRLAGISGKNMIPGTSAIKKNFASKIRNEDNCYEDRVFYSVAYLLNPTVAFDKKIRFEYSGFHSENKALKEVSDYYVNMILGKRTIYTCWFSNSMSSSRKECLRTLIASSKVEVKIITNKTFYNYENSEIPIHKGFGYLSDVHKSDYARAYIMYFYGGGYSDIKANDFNWNPYFDMLLSSKYDAIGYAEKDPSGLAPFWVDDQQTEKDAKSNYNKFAGNGHYIFKPKTRFAHDWLLEIHKIMDDNYEKLRNNPARHPYNVNGGIHSSFLEKVPESLISMEYPFFWSEINGNIRHRLEYQRGLKSFMLEMPFPNMNNYR